VRNVQASEGGDADSSSALRWLLILLDRLGAEVGIGNGRLESQSAIVKDLLDESR